LAYFASGLTIVAPDEVAIVRRFGNPIDGDLSPGWYWRYPWPIEETTRVSQQARTVNIGFREATNVQAGALTWSSAHRKDRDQKEAMMITGDGNLADLLVSVRYKITQPRVYLFGVSDADEILRAAAESELRAMVAGRSFLDLLTAQRGKFQRDILERVKERCHSSYPTGLGIEIDDIAIIDLHPPSEVVDSYYEVAKAMEQRDQRINIAKEQAINKHEKAASEIVRILSSARASKTEKVQEAERDRARFLAHHRPRVELSSDDETALAMRAAQQLFAGQKLDEIATTYHVERGTRLAQLPALVEFRLYWDAAARSLSGRKMLLIDSDKVVGRRNLMLFDPEQFRIPIPMLLPQERAPRNAFPPETKSEN
jgi:regulator of protease activity HflC (stomatin/prohibitin superfamily)